MPAPPSGPKTSDSQADIAARAAIEKQLEEVEAAIAVLQGQDPEQLRKLREARAQAEREYQEIVARMEANRARKARRLARKRRQLVLRTVVGVVAIGALVAFGRVSLEGRARWKAVNEALDKMAAPYLAKGMKTPATKLATGNRVELNVPPGSCLIALAATNTGADAEIHVERGLLSLRGQGSLAWCSCAEEQIVVSARGSSPDSLVGVKVLAAQGSVLGGSRALRLLEPPPKSFGPVAQECEPDHLDGWVKAGRAPKAEIDPTWFEKKPERAILATVGATIVARIPESRPMGAVGPLGESCYLAVTEPSTAPVTLRIEGGATPLRNVTDRPLAWCSNEAATFTLWRDAPGEVTVLAVPSARVGGLLGLRALARRAGVGDPSIWAAPGKTLGIDAADLLKASGVVDPVITWPEPEEGPNRPVQPRVVGISVLEGGSFLPDPKSDAVTVCEPELAPGRAGQTLCLQSWPQEWRRVGSAELGGLAEGPLPYWLSSIQGVDHPTGLSRYVSLLALARRLHAEGFEPTVLEGVTELKNGVQVMGRVGEDAIVAVGLLTRPPWLIPYSDVGSWEIDGEPRVVELYPGEQRVLLSKTAAAIPVGERRTIVFRRNATKKQRQEETAAAN